MKLYRQMHTMYPLPVVNTLSNTIYFLFPHHTWKGRFTTMTGVISSTFSCYRFRIRTLTFSKPNYNRELGGAVSLPSGVQSPEQLEQAKNDFKIMPIFLHYRKILSQKVRRYIPRYSQAYSHSQKKLSPSSDSTNTQICKTKSSVMTFRSSFETLKL